MNFLYSFLFLQILCCACKSTSAENSRNPISKTDSIELRDNELENADSKNTLTISGYNTDLKSVENIERPGHSTVQTLLDTNILFQTWTIDPLGPHADFEISRHWFSIADYDGNGDMPYELIERNLKVYYNDFIQNGEIISAEKDSLKIMWEDRNEITVYQRWKQ
jgi:hypothetical protein